MNTEINFIKRPIEDILKDSQKIDSHKISREILFWLIANVENFIDNSVKMFKLDLIVDQTSGMEETKKLQDLYRAIPDDEENKIILEKSQECRRILDEITALSCNHMKESNDLLQQLFQRMIFYYEKIIPNPENRKRAMQIDEELRNLITKKETLSSENEKQKIQKQIVEKIQEGEKLIQFEKLDGQINITKFDYDAFDVNVQIKEGHNPDADNQLNEQKILKQYTIPEGFILWLEICFKQQQRPTSIF